MAQINLGSEAKKTLMSFVKECDLHLEKYWDEELCVNFGYNQTQRDLVKKMLLHAKEHNLRAAKRLRASFVYYGFLLGNQSADERIWKAAEAVEMVHTSLLMHDDFTDMDVVRRGKPTTHVYFGEGDFHYGNSMAVYVGDTVLCLGFERLISCGFEAGKVQLAMKRMLRGIANTAFGQSYDVSLPKLGELTEEKVMSLHRAKTAIYTYENPLWIGALLGDVPEEALSVLSEYSVNGGVAFQLQDDILGVFGDEEKTGKSANSDILQGKVTLLAVKVLEFGNQRQRNDFLKVWGKPGAKEGDIENAKRAIVESGSYKYSFVVARDLAKKAAGCVSKLRDMNLNQESIDYLEGVALYMADREV